MQQKTVSDSKTSVRDYHHLRGLQQIQFGSGSLVAHRKNAFVLQGLPKWLWISAAVLAPVGVFTANPSLTPFAILMVPMLTRMLWLEGEPPLLLFACLMQWL